MIGLGFCREHNPYAASFGNRSQAKTTKILALPGIFSTTPACGSLFSASRPPLNTSARWTQSKAPLALARYEADGRVNQTETPSKFALLSSELPDCVDITSSAPTLDSVVVDA